MPTQNPNGNPPKILTEASMRPSEFSSLTTQVARYIERLPDNQNYVMRLEKRGREWRIVIERALHIRDWYLTK